MKSCSMKDFMQELAPWLDKNYIREARLDDDGNIVLLFQDGVRDVFQTGDCTKEQTDGIFKDFKDNGIAVL